MKKYFAEFFGTFWLVLGGCGSAVIAATFKGSIGEEGTTAIVNLGIGLLGVAVAFGLTVVTMAYAVGHISGGHFNPAVSFGLWAGKRFSGSELLPYIIAQVLGATLAGAIIWLIASGQGPIDFTGSNPLATNGYGDHSPGKFNLLSCLIMEVVMTFMFLLVILGVTDRRAPVGFAPLAIGLALTLIHLISIPVTNTSVNPARSTGVALMVLIKGYPALFSQLWMFWLAPIVGAVLAGWVHLNLLEPAREDLE